MKNVPSGVSEISETENVCDRARQQCNLVEKKTRRIQWYVELGVGVRIGRDTWVVTRSKSDSNPIEDKKRQRWTQSRRAKGRAGAENQGGSNGSHGAEMANVSGEIMRFRCGA
jgi:hypothetical protein